MSEDERSESIGVEELKNLVGELRMMAHQLLSTESSMHSFTPTALAMTALRRAKLKDQDWTDVRWENRGHFFSALTRAMRNALIDHARHRKARGRGNLLYFAPDESFFFNLPEEADVRPERILLCGVPHEYHRGPAPLLHCQAGPSERPLFRKLHSPHVCPLLLPTT